MKASLRLHFRCLLTLLLAGCLHGQNTVITFEPPLPSGLTPMSFWEDTPVLPQAKITNQYGSIGVLMANVALVNLGTGQATSGSNGIAPISQSGKIDYASAIAFTFVDPQNNSAPAATDYFAISTDKAGGSGNTTTVSAYDLNGKLLGSTFHSDSGGVTLQLQVVGMHSVVVSSTLQNHSSGGIALDDLRFGTVSTSTPSPSASHGCTLANIIGSYGYAISGIAVSNGVPIPYADSGVLTSDGKGTLSGSSTVSVGGQIVPRTLTGTYAINADCTGSVVFPDGLGNSPGVNATVLKGGEEVLFIQTSTGAIVSGSAKRRRSSCTTADLNGSYGLAINGWYLAAGSSQGFAESGELIADGAGGLTLKDTVSQGGTISTRNLSGSYALNGDCTGSAAFSDPSLGSIHANFTLVSGSREIEFIQTDAGAILSGTATRRFSPAGVLSQVASGGVWKTTITIVSLAQAPNEVNVKFWADDGSGLTLPYTATLQGTSTTGTGSSVDRTIPPGGTLVIETQAATALLVGWAQVLSSGPVEGSAIFRSHNPSGSDSEGTAILDHSAALDVLLPFDNTAGFVTGAAFVNLAPATPGSIAVTIRDDSGAWLATDTITLPANGHSSFAVNTQFPGTSGKRGTLELKGISGGGIAGLGLRFSPAGSFTSIPLIVRE